MRANTLVAALLVSLSTALTACAAPVPPAPTAAPTDAVTFRTHPDPMVGGFSAPTSPKTNPASRAWTGSSRCSPPTRTSTRAAIPAV